MAVNSYNTAEGGINGVTVTSGNSGGASGTIFSSVTLGTGSITFTNSIANSGNYSYKLTAGAASNCRLALAISANIMSMRAYMYFTGYPTTATQLIQFFSNTSLAVIALSPAGKVTTQANAVSLDNGTTVLPLNTWLRVELSARVSSGAPDGYVAASVWLGDDTLSPLYSYSNNATDTGTVSAGSCSFGKVSNAGNWATMYVDDILVQDTLTPLGPANTTPISWIP